MKKLFSIALALLLALTLCACGGNAGGDPTTSALDTVNDTSNAGTTLSSPSDAAPSDTTLSSLAVRQDEAAQQAAADKLASYDVDIDLMGLNNNMTTAQMQAIMQDPSSYMGKTIRVTGIYETSYYEQTGLTYNYIIGYDDTGCCAAWNMEFSREGIPADLERYSVISLVGKIDTYDELGVTYTYINVDHIATA